MKLSNIHNGLIVKNYKEMCSLLSEPVLSGNSKKAQLKEWERYFKCHKDGNRFVIDEVYNEPKPKIDNRGYGFTDHIEKLILDLLAQDENNGMLFFPKYILLRELKMINGNYAYCKQNSLKLSLFLNINKDDVHEFYESADNTLIGSLESALNKLKKKSLVSWTQVKTICFAEGKVIKNDSGDYKVKEVFKGHNQYGEEMYEYELSQHVSHKRREVTDEEDQLIIFTEREVMKAMGCKDKQEVVKFGKWDEYTKTVKMILMDKANIEYYYDSYKIIFNEVHILEELEEIERAEQQVALNKAVKNKIMNNAVNRQKDAFNTPSSDKNYIRRTSESYLSNQSKLVMNLIDSNNHNIKNAVRRTLFH
jgi:hypothetical protein